MPIIVTAKQYLDDLKEQESRKSGGDRKPVPSKQAIADASGVTRQAIYDFLGREKHQRPDLDIIAGIITACINHGHPTKLTDLLRYEK